MAGRQATGEAAVTPQLQKIADTSHELLSSVGEMVWATNPRNDSLENFLGYLASYAQEFLHPAGLACRLDIPTALPNHPLRSEVRHHVFYAFKEALTNIVKHARAREVWVRVRLTDSTLELCVEDNGCGFEIRNPKSEIRTASGGNGLVNIRQRLEAVGGNVELDAQPSHGTKLCLTVPLRAAEQPM
jgi:signal transduction histidine kinase